MYIDAPPARANHPPQRREIKRALQREVVVPATTRCHGATAQRELCFDSKSDTAERPSAWEVKRFDRVKVSGRGPISWPSNCRASSADTTRRYTPPSKRSSRAPGTPCFAFKDIDENRPSSSIRIRAETIDYFLERYAEERREKRYRKVKVERLLAVGNGSSGTPCRGIAVSSAGMVRATGRADDSRSP
jgi:hypothetical protein